MSNCQSQIKFYQGKIHSIIPKITCISPSPPPKKKNKKYFLLGVGKESNSEKYFNLQKKQNQYDHKTQSEYLLRKQLALSK